MNNELKLNVAPNTDGVLIVRHGQALPLKEPQVIKLDGNIESVSAFLTSRRRLLDSPAEGAVNATGLQVIESKKAVVVVDEESGKIVLQLDPENAYGASVTGSLVEADELSIFKVNSGNQFSREQLIKLFRLNRRFFARESEHTELLSAFTKFSAKVYCDLDKDSDDRGNASSVFKRTVNSNVPLSFKLKMPIYKGQKAETFTVDILIEPQGSNVFFYFESVELIELLEERKKEIFARELEHCKEFPIIKK